MVTKSKRSATHDDENFDELANALLGDSSPIIERSPTHSRVRGQTPTSSGSRVVTPERSGIKTLNKPLPPLPRPLLRDIPLAMDSPIHDSIRNKATHIQKSKKPETSRTSLTKALTPSLVSPYAGSRLASSQSGTLQVSRTNNERMSPSTSTTDAAALSRKLTDLMQKAAASNSNVLVDQAKREKAGGRTPLQRGKEALTKAKRAIVGHIDSSQEREGRIKLNEESRSNASIDRLEKEEYSMGEDTSELRLNRRLAEGSNLSITKIQEVLGDGRIRRKPLPIYEKMKAKRLSASLRDHFSAAKKRQASPINGDVSSLWLDNKNGQSSRASTSSFDALMTQPQTITDASNGFSPDGTRSTSRFSDKVSGLSQHPDTAVFSSSPVDFSTPRICLQPQSDVHGKKRLTAVLVDDPDTPGSSLDDLADDDHCMSIQEGAEPSTGSLKRKSGTQDLRSAPESITKRPKKELKLELSADDLALAAGFKKLETKDRAVLSDKDKNMKIGVNDKRTSKANGLAIFDTKKLIPSSASMVDLVNRPSARISDKRSSIPRPSSIVYARDYRTYTPMADRLDDDVMALGELQMNDSNFQIGSKI